MMPAMPRPAVAQVQWRGAKTFLDPEKEEVFHDMVHFKKSANPHPMGLQKNLDHRPKPSEFWDNPMQHAVWTAEEVNSVKETHVEPTDFADRAAYYLVQIARKSFDFFSGYSWGPITYNKVLYRAMFLETVAGVPGMTAGMLRHLRSLRTMNRDHGWIHTLLEEAENERMHLLTFIQLKKPGPFFRLCVVGAQGVFMNAFFLMYLISPRTCHRFVGYLEEEAVHTYGTILEAIDDGRLEAWKTQPAPPIAINYWHMHPDATMRDLILQVRADEASHRDVNHTFSSLRLDQTNPLVHAHAHTLMKPAEMHTPADHATATRHKEFEDEQAAEKLAKQAA
jgi:hypothetical protein